MATMADLLRRNQLAAMQSRDASAQDYTNAGFNATDPAVAAAIAHGTADMPAAMRRYQDSFNSSGGASNPWNVDPRTLAGNPNATAAQTAAVAANYPGGSPSTDMSNPNGGSGLDPGIVLGNGATNPNAPNMMNTPGHMTGNGSPTGASGDDSIDPSTGQPWAMGSAGPYGNNASGSGPWNNYGNGGINPGGGLPPQNDKILTAPPGSRTSTPYGGSTPNATGGFPITGSSTSSPGANPYAIENYLDPSMKFTEDQGLRALNSQQAATGQISSGNSLKDILNYSQGLASTNYNSAAQQASADRGFGYQAALNDQTIPFQEQLSLAGLGMQGAQGTANQSNLNATLQAQLAQALGQAQGTGTIGANNSITSGIGQFINNLNGGGLTLSQILAKYLTPPTTPAPAGG